MALRISEQEAVRMGLIPPPQVPPNRVGPDQEPPPTQMWLVLAFFAGVVAGMMVMALFIPLPPPCRPARTVGLDRQSTTMVEWKEVELYRRLVRWQIRF